MKVYQVKMSYYDDDHEHGYYESPLFKTKEDAERFLNFIKSLPDGDPRKWWTCSWYGEDSIEENAYIDEMEVKTFDENDVSNYENYLTITYT